MDAALFHAVLDFLSRACLFAGGIFCMIGALGLLRLPDFYTRLHAASVIETLGAGLLLLGMMLHAGLTMVTVKLVFIGVLLFFVSPTATHALARAAHLRGVKPELAVPDQDLQEPVPTDTISPEHLPSKP
jgi:multicomponent Na+:H+ antiporter subunit G